MNTHAPKDAKDNSYVSAFALPKGLVPLGTAILGALVTALLTWIAPENTQWTFPARVVALSLSAIGVLILVLGIWCHQLWQRTRTRVRFGILWNADRQPFCAKCEGPLEVRAANAFYCPLCNIESGPHDITGAPITTHEALKRIRLQKYWRQN